MRIELIERGEVRATGTTDDGRRFVVRVRPDGRGPRVEGGALTRSERVEARLAFMHATCDAWLARGAARTTKATRQPTRRAAALAAI